MLLPEFDQRDPADAGAAEHEGLVAGRTRAFASMPERSMRSPPATPTPSKAMAPMPARMMSREPGAELADGIEVEDVGAEAADQQVAAGAADQHVVAAEPLEVVAARAAAESLLA